MNTDLTLRRLALLELTPAPGGEASIRGTYSDVVVETLLTKHVGGSLKLLLVAACPLKHLPKRTRTRYVVVPEVSRRQCEFAIEAFADLIAISQKCRRSIASPFPWVAFEATTDAGQQWLSDSVGIHKLDYVAQVASASSEVPLNADLIDGLSDRSDGTVLMAEALSQGHPSGQLHDFFRVFERAFALPARRLTQPLDAFLDDRYGCTPAELDKWIEIRDGASHADTRKQLVLEADVRPILARVRQAAYDVLFNKRLWRNPSPDRRELWSPSGWTAAPSGQVVMKQHSTGRLEAQLLDQFGAYPTDLEGVLTSLPPTWWAPAVTPQTTQTPFRVIPSDEERPKP
jgi:hypothetical protein